MRVMVIVKATAESEAGVMPSEQLLRDMGNFNEELVHAGIMLAGEGLHPSSNGYRVRFSGKNRIVIDGPFAETKELIAGFWMWKVDSMEEAIDWVKRCPNPHEGECEIEIRRVFEADDFGEEFTPELREQEAALRAKTMGLDVRFENGREILVGGINQTYTFETRVAIPKQWDRFAPHIGKLPGQTGSYAYGVCWNYQPGRGFDYLTGVAVTSADALPPDFSSVRLQASRYAVFTHDGHVSNLIKTVETIWAKWLPESGLHPLNAPSFERYSEAFDPHTGRGGIEVWIPIQG